MAEILFLSLKYNPRVIFVLKTLFQKFEIVIHSVHQSTSFKFFQKIKNKT